MLRRVAEPVVRGQWERTKAELTRISASWQLEHGPLYRFGDWPNPEVPNWRARVYTARGEFISVEIVGCSLLAGTHKAPEAVANQGKRKGPGAGPGRPSRHTQPRER